jgi:hypothetical protein
VHKLVDNVQVALCRNGPLTLPLVGFVTGYVLNQWSVPSGSGRVMLEASASASGERESGAQIRIWLKLQIDMLSKSYNYA